MFDLCLSPLPPEAAIEHLVDSRYGFSLIDIGVTLEDLADFDQIEISEKRDYNRCGDLDKVEGETAIFLSQIGNNDPQIISRVSFRIGQIANRILKASNKDTAWVCLRASTPVNANDIFRWHFDWPYYPSNDMQIRFAMTLRGPPTLFYPLPIENTELREKIWKRINDSDFIASFCDPGQAFMPNREIGVVFINREKGALHSEPPNFNEGRLFLSIVPCSREEMLKMEPRVKAYFHLK